MEIVVRMWTAADWKDEVVAVGVGEVPVLSGVSGVPRTLEGKCQHSRVIGQ